MAHLIEGMMNRAGVVAAKLQAKKEISTSFGETLSWDYYSFAKQNELRYWDTPTSILYGSEDNVTDKKTAEAFAAPVRLRSDRCGRRGTLVSHA